MLTHIVSLVLLCCLVSCASRPSYLLRVDDKVWRGSQPLNNALSTLPQSIKNILDLRDDSIPGYAEAVKRSGRFYWHVPMSGWQYPDKKKIHQALEEIKASKGEVLVHCRWGHERTGIVIAEWRKLNGWSSTASLNEAKKVGVSCWYLPAVEGFVLAK